MRVVMIASEAAPYAKIGGLADVMEALPPHLEKLGASISVVIPRHRQIDLNRFHFEPFPFADDIRVPLGVDQFEANRHTFFEPLRVCPAPPFPCRTC